MKLPMVHCFWQFDKFWVTPTLHVWTSWDVEVFSKREVYQMCHFCLQMHPPPAIPIFTAYLTLEAYLGVECATKGG